MKTKKKPPDRIVISWCPKCGQPQCAARRSQKGLVSKAFCSFCPGAVEVKVVAYRIESPC